MSEDERLAEILGAIIDRYDAQPVDRRRRLVHLRYMQGEGFHDWDDDLPNATRDDLDELRDSGLIDVDYSSRDLNYLVKPTADGRSTLGRYRRERARGERQAPIDLSWAAARPVLHAVVDVWASVGAPDGLIGAGQVAKRLDVADDDLGFIRTLELLARADWLEVDYEGDEQVPHVRPTMRGVMATRGWPGGDGEVAAERLLSVLDEVERSSPDEAERGWAQRARDTLMEVGTKTLAEVVSKSVGTAL